MESISARSRALNLPEILLHIFSFLEGDFVTLNAVAQVNARWFDCGIEFLWKQAWSHLPDIPPRRRPIYASKVQMMFFDGPHNSLLLQNLKFTNLRAVHLEPARYLKQEPLCVEPYIQPALEHFACLGGDLTLAHFHQLSTTSVRLRSIHLENPGPHITPKALLNLVERLRGLEVVDLVDGMDHLITDDVLLCLAQRENLKVLKLAGFVSEAAFDKMVTSTEKPLRSVQRLLLRLPSTVVPRLVELIAENITSLTLKVDGNDVRVLEHVSSLTDLERLHLLFGQPTTLSVSELSTLARLVNLKNLHLSTYPDLGKDIEAYDFTDHHFQKLVSQLRGLEFLSFKVNSKVSSAALADLYSVCPSLKLLGIMSKINFQWLPTRSEEPAWFPEMRTLYVSGIDTTRPDDRFDEFSTIADVAQKVAKHFPQLQGFYSYTACPFWELVMEEWVRLKFERAIEESLNSTE